MLTRFAPPTAILLLTLPILAGLAGTVLPAFGYLPALGGEALSLEPWRMLLAQPGLMMSSITSLLVGLVASGIALLGVLLLFAGWAGTPAFRRIQHLVSPLLAVPHAAAAFGLAFLIAPSGFLARLVSPELTGWTRPPDLLIVNDSAGLAMMAGLIVKEMPFLFLMALAALPQADPARGRALAASLGYGRMAGFIYCVWPPLYRQMRLATFAVIAFSTSVVDVAAILGPTTPAPLGVRLVTWMNDPDLSTRFMASAGALLQLALTATAMLAWLGVERLGAMVRDWARDDGLRFRRERWVVAFSAPPMLVASTATIAGLILLALWSVAGQWPFPDALPQALSLTGWMKQAPRLSGTLAATLGLAALSAFAALVIVVLCLMREDETGRRPGQAGRALLYLPLIVPQAAFLFGLQFLLASTGSVGAWAPLVLVHLVFVTPYVFLSLSDAWRAFDRRYEAVAAGLGKGRWTILLSVRLPLLLRAVLTAFGVGFAVSVGLYLPTVLIGAGRIVTITTEAVALASSGDRRIIGIYAFLQMLLPLIGFAIATLVPALLWRNRRALRG
jgi:putative thiamine transport system permease protein